MFYVCNMTIIIENSSIIDEDETYPRDIKVNPRALYITAEFLSLYKSIGQLTILSVQQNDLTFIVNTK